jgi:hypothetical protein
MLRQVLEFIGPRGPCGIVDGGDLQQAFAALEQLTKEQAAGAAEPVDRYPVTTLHDWDLPDLSSRLPSKKSSYYRRG